VLAKFVCDNARELVGSRCATIARASRELQRDEVVAVATVRT
jgi:hypothetical protein